jgi:hypothetical protein
MATSVADKETGKTQRAKQVGADYVELRVFSGRSPDGEVRWEGDEVWVTQLVGPAGFMDRIVEAVKAVVGEVSAAHGAVVEVDWDK